MDFRIPFQDIAFLSSALGVVRSLKDAFIFLVSLTLSLPKTGASEGRAIRKGNVFVLNQLHLLGLQHLYWSDYCLLMALQH